MAIQSLRFCSSQRLKCAGCEPAKIIICIARDIVALPQCPTTGSPLLRPHFIYGTLERSFPVKSECGQVSWVYLIHYDDTQIAPPHTLQPSDITGIVCEGCLTSWVKDMVGQPVTLTTTSNGNTLTLTNQYGCLYNIDLLTCSEVPSCETPLTVVDTNTVNLTTSGVSQHTLQADVRISTQAGNDLQALPDGLYVNISGGCDEIRSCFSGVNTPSIQYNYNAVTGQHSANVRISSAANNCLTINPDGLYNPCETPNTVTDTNSIDLTASGPFNRNIQANVRISSAANNCLTVNPDGLYNPCETPNTVTDTNSVDLTASGPFNRNIQADVRISSAAGNTIVVNADGLYSAGTFPAAGCGIAVSGNQVSVNTSGSWGSGSLAFPCSDANGAPIYCDSTGRIRTIPAYGGVRGQDQTQLGPPYPGGDDLLDNVGESRQTADTVINFANPSPCRNMIVVGNNLTRLYGDVRLDVKLEYVNFLDVGFGFLSYNMRDTFSQIFVTNSTADRNSSLMYTNVVPPGGSVTIRGRSVVTCLDLNGTGARYRFNNNGLLSTLAAWGYVV